MRPSDYERFLQAIFARLLSEYPAQVFWRRSYVGKSGQSYEFDIAIELELMKVSYLTIVEAKYYRRKVGLDEVHELAGKTADVAAHKAILVTTVGYQLGALQVAASKGVALVVCDPQRAYEFEVVLKRHSLPSHPARDASNIDNALTQVLERVAEAATAAVSECRG